MSLDFNNQEYFTHVLNNKGKLLEVPLRRGRNDSAFIDYLTFTFDKTSLNERIQEKQKVVYFTQPDDEVYIHFFSEILTDIFGFGITEKRQGKGKYFYNAYYQLGSMDVNYGTVHIGGQRNTILVDLSGVGCQAALAGWENRLYQFSNWVERFSIPRVDLAADFLNGEYSTLSALSDYNKCGFDVKGMRPKYKLEGTDWFNNDNSGKTLYIGRRGSSKFCRIYEKGKQLGDEESQWTRFEIEFRKNDCLIPTDILIKPGSFLTGAYPVGEKLFTAQANRIHASVKKAETTLDEKIYHGRNQVGKLVRYLFDLGWKPEEIVQSLIAEQGKYPNGLKPLEYDCSSKEVEYIHEQKVFEEDKELSEFRQMLVNNKIPDFVLSQLDDDIEHFNHLKMLAIKSDQELQTLLDEIFNKYSKYNPFLKQG